MSKYMQKIHFFLTLRIHFDIHQDIKNGELLDWKNPGQVWHPCHPYTEPLVVYQPFWRMGSVEKIVEAVDVLEIWQQK